MPMACQSKRLARCWATRSYPRRRSMPASSTKPSAARWTNSPKPSAAQALALVEGKTRRKRQPQRILQPQPTLLYQHPQPQTYKHNKGARLSPGTLFHNIYLKQSYNHEALCYIRCFSNSNLTNGDNFFIYRIKSSVALRLPLLSQYRFAI